MDHLEFKKYLTLLFKPFALYPEPTDMDAESNRFTYVSYNATHVTIRNTTTQSEHLIPLKLIEFASRPVTPHNGSFV
jgi:hypothetical protein